MITSPSNPRIRALAALHKRSEREATGTFLIEGRREIERAIARNFELVTVVRREGARALDLEIDELEVGPAAFDRIAYGRDSLVAVAQTPSFDLDRLGIPELLLIAAEIEKPGNLGAMLRTCDAVGAAMLLADPVTDITNPNTVRASTGAFFTVPIAVATSEAALSWIDISGFRLVASMVGGGKAPWEVDLAARVAIVIGSEDRGLSRQWLDAAKDRVTLPQTGEVDSLNAAVTAAVLLYEAVRQKWAGSN